MIQAFYKQKGISSYDVIRILKKHYPGEKIGHGGTLDPLADGVLVIGIGKEGTRGLSAVLKGTDKEYVVEIELGKVSETDDAEGPIKAYKPSETQHPSQEQAQDSLQEPTLEDIHATLQKFTGKIMQTPPKYSAVKIKGKSAYKRARNGEEFTIEPKKVEIKELELLEYTYPFLKLRLTTGSGVYIRSLARDLGEMLGVGGYVSQLTRTRVGEFTIDDAVRLHVNEHTKK